MQFNDTSGRSGIIQAIERYCGLQNTAISGDSNLLKEFTASANESSRTIWSWIFQAYGGWIYDDSNQTDLPQATQNLVTSTRQYALPSTALTVQGIHVMDTAGAFFRLNPVTLEKITQYGFTPDNYRKTDGIPVEYRLVGSTAEIFPAASYSQTGGFKVFFERGTVSFSTSDTTKTPGFASEFHNAVAVGAALDWMKIHKPQSPTTALLMDDWNKDPQNSFKARITDYYERRWRDNFPLRMHGQFTKFK